MTPLRILAAVAFTASAGLAYLIGQQVGFDEGWRLGTAAATSP